TTTADRTFSLNETLGALQLARSGARLTASFTLAHPASVRVSLEKANGVVLATLLSKRLDAGQQSASWRGSVPPAARGAVVATNAIGKAALVAPLTAARR